MINPCDCYQEIDCFIKDIQDGLIWFHWTYCHIEDFENHLGNMFYSSEKDKNCIQNELNIYLSNWQYEIVKVIVDKFYDDDNNNAQYRIVHFSYSELFMNVNLYLYYYVNNKDIRWLKETIYKIYDDCDVVGLKQLYQYFVQAYLNVDNVHNMEKCHSGFKSIHKLITSKCNKVKVDNYEILYVLENYININNNKEIYIQNLYRKLTNELFDKLYSTLLEKYEYDYKEQHQRTINLLKIILSVNNHKQSTLLETLGLKFIYNIKYFCAKKQHIKQNAILSFIAFYIFKKKYLFKKLELFEIDTIKKYFELMMELCRKIKPYNIEKVMKIINHFENIVINKKKVTHIPNYIIHFVD